MLKVGVIGVGAIAQALTVGLCAFGDERAQILLSPRNEVITDRLARLYPAVKVGADNQAVLDESEIVILALRPQVAKGGLAGLRFRPDHQIVSLIATFSVDQLASLVTPAHNISRAVPLPPVADRQGPLTLYTQSAEVLQLLDGLGHLVRVADEAHLDLVSAVTSLMSTYFGVTEAIHGWMMKHGFEADASRAFVAELFWNLANVARKPGAGSFGELSVEYATPAGLNEQAWRELRSVGWPDHIQATLNLLLERIHGRATFDSHLSFLSEQRSSG